MRRLRAKTYLIVGVCIASQLLVAGCAHRRRTPVLSDPASCPSPAMSAGNSSQPVIYDTIGQPPEPLCRNLAPSLTDVAPRTVDEVPTEFRDLELDEAVRLAIENSEVIRDVGGRVLRGPDGASTIHDVAIDYTDPILGVEAALSEFDANLGSRFNYAKNDRVFNNQTLGGGAQELQQDFTFFESELSKTSAAGTQAALRSQTSHDRNNRLNNLFGHVWESQVEAELRQPLLQGRGTQFNRIAGPAGRPGLRFSNGVVIAQMNNDISKADFEIAVRDFVGRVEESYWRLQQAYLDFDSKRTTQEAAEKTLVAIQAKRDNQLLGGEADKEAQAREQFYLFQDLAIESLNGSATSIGVYEAERQLRELLGLAHNDGLLLRPTSEVYAAEFVYDWPSMLEQAIARRAEVRRQMWKIRQEELRLVAAKNFLLPRMDATALYRLRGFGDDLAGNGNGRFSSASQDLSNFDHQEWEFGLEFSVPIGNRQALAGVRNAELRLARERSILREQEHQVSHELANAIGRAVQTQRSLQVTRRRVQAAHDRMAASEAAFAAGKLSLDQLLEAQERLGAAQSRLFSQLAAHAIAQKNVRQSTGELLASHGVHLQAESPTPVCSAVTKRRDEIDYRYSTPTGTSCGPYDQEVMSTKVSVGHGPTSQLPVSQEAEGAIDSVDEDQQDVAVAGRYEIRRLAEVEDSVSVSERDSRLVR